MITKWKSCKHVVHEFNIIVRRKISYLLGFMELWCISLAIIAIVISAVSVGEACRQEVFLELGG